MVTMILPSACRGDAPERCHQRKGWSWSQSWWYFLLLSNRSSPSYHLGLWTEAIPADHPHTLRLGSLRSLRSGLPLRMPIKHWEWLLVPATFRFRVWFGNTSNESWARTQTTSLPTHLCLAPFLQILGKKVPAFRNEPMHRIIGTAFASFQQNPYNVCVCVSSVAKRVCEIALLLQPKPKTPQTSICPSTSASIVGWICACVSWVKYLDLYIPLLSE